MGKQNDSGDESDVYGNIEPYSDSDDDDSEYEYDSDDEEINLETEEPHDYYVSSQNVVLAQEKLFNTLTKIEREKGHKINLSEGLKNFLDNLQSLTAEAEKLSKSGYQDDGMELNVYVTRSYDALANFLNDGDEEAFSKRLDQHTADAKQVFESKYHLSIFSLIPNILRKILGIPPKTMQIINANAEASKTQNQETSKKIKEEILEIKGLTTEHLSEEKGYKK